MKKYEISEIPMEDGLLRAAGELLAEEELERFDGMNVEEHVFSRRSLRRLAKIGAGEERGDAGVRRIRLRAALAVGILAALSVTAAAAGPLLWARTTVERAEDGLTPSKWLVSVEAGEIGEEAGRGEPSWLPEGYEESLREDRDELTSHVIYLRTDGCYSSIEFERVPWDPANTVAYGNGNDGTDVRLEPVSVGPYEGVLMTVDWADGNVGETAYVLWSDGAAMYRVSAIVTDPPEGSALEFPPVPLPIEELFRVAESVCGGAE